MAYKTANFESGVAEGADAYDSDFGASYNPTLETTNPITGAGSARHEIGGLGHISIGNMFLSGTPHIIEFDFELPSTDDPDDGTSILAVGLRDGDTIDLANRIFTVFKRSNVHIAGASLSLRLESSATWLGHHTPVNVGSVYRIKVEWTPAVSGSDGVYKFSVGVNGGALSVIAEGNHSDTRNPTVAVFGVDAGRFGSSWYISVPVLIDNIALSNTSLTNDLDIRYTLINPTTAQLVWSAVSGGTRYGIEWSDDDGASWTLIDDIQDFIFVHINRILGADYLYRVKVEIDETPEYSEPVPVPAPDAIITTPTGLASTVSGAAPTLTWDAVGDATHYDLRYSTNGTDWTYIENVQSGYTVPGLATLTTYQFQVRSESGTGLSEWSASTTVETLAHVAIVSSNTGGSAALSLQSALEASGHSTAMVSEANHATTDFDPYDVVASVFPSVANGAATTLRALSDAGKPLLLPLLTSNITTNTESIPKELDLTGDRAYGDNVNLNTDVVILDTEHVVTAGFALGTINTQSGDNYVAVLATGAPYVGDVLATGDPSMPSQADLPNLIAIEVGTEDLLGVALGSRVAIAGFMYTFSGSDAYTADGKSLLDATVMWLVDAPDAPGSSESNAHSSMRLSVGITI